MRIADRGLGIENPKKQWMRFFSVGQQRVLFVLALFVLAVFYFRFYHPSNPSFSERTIQEFVIEVVGEVNRPGIHLFQEPPTLKRTIEKAGGLKEAAVLDAGLSPEVLEAGTLLTVVKESPGKIKIKIGRMDARKLLVFSIPLDLNRVSMEDLCLIPGIGESLAREIVAYRERRNGFRSLEELKKVNGIGEKKYHSLKHFFVIK